MMNQIISFHTITLWGHQSQSYITRASIYSDTHTWMLFPKFCGHQSIHLFTLQEFVHTLIFSGHNFTHSGNIKHVNFVRTPSCLHIHSVGKEKIWPPAGIRIKRPSLRSGEAVSSNGLDRN